MYPPLPTVLSIAGSDPSGGAGIQADLKTFSALGVYGMAAITALTIQNSQGVSDVYPVAPECVSAQIGAVLSDIGANAIKTGMLSNEAVIHAVASVLRKYPTIPLVLDPVLISTSGRRLLDESALQALKKNLIPFAAIVTPNASEAQVLTGLDVMQSLEIRKEAAKKILALGCRAVLIKGGHLGGETSCDLWFDGYDFAELSAERLDNPNTHGTGCMLSSAIAAFLAQGRTPLNAVQSAKAFLTEAIRHAFPLGKGIGPVNPLWNTSTRPATPWGAATPPARNSAP
ncbi:TPA: bifunctional hydroxymethylpyrimidine kinase/phosphomethylpyrimidine kinase [Candidatus Sumerlaeota bacterium]|jgi:hydroxymethylpyrimidine kinase/phosphomethylpyrimidine kinase|nr:bifunctional hydroxymethylpyrimidine kinase/phosphomethylpyrimidine kinase [Candidatus Sumerlaeota bacterium]